MVFNATFDNISAISWHQFYWWGNRSTRQSRLNNII